jgi:hypothetical protein
MSCGYSVHYCNWTTAVPPNRHYTAAANDICLLLLKSSISQKTEWKTMLISWVIISVLCVIQWCSECLRLYSIGDRWMSMEQWWNDTDGKIVSAGVPRIHG